MKAGAGIVILMLLGACGPARKPPANTRFDGLPITGSVAFAKQQGFARCIDLSGRLRCRRSGVTFAGQGPFEGAVDSPGSDGAGGFRELLMWDDRDQFAVTLVGKQLLADGWRLCRTGSADRGDQNIYRRTGSKIRVSIDASYWGKGRLRIMVEDGRPTGRCWV